MIIRVQIYTKDFSKLVDGVLNTDHMVYGVEMEHSVPDPMGGKKLEVQKHIRFVSAGGISCDVPYHLRTMELLCSKIKAGTSVPECDPSITRTKTDC